MVRSDKYGHYTQMSHARGFSNSLQSVQFLKNSTFSKRSSKFHGAHWIALDGLNSLFYKLEKTLKNQAYIHAYFEIRNFIPNQLILSNLNTKFKSVINMNKQISPEVSWKTYSAFKDFGPAPKYGHF